MEPTFAEILRTLRAEKNLSQKQLADKLFVDRSSIAHWENGRRLPDAILISRLAVCLDVDVSVLLNAASRETASPNVIIVDDEDIMLAGAIPVLTAAMPNASIVGFTRASEALAYARENRVSIAFLDIEIGKTSGIELCRRLVEIYPFTNVIFLTAYPGYAISAWDTPASGFLVKPLHEEDVLSQLKKLRYSVGGLR
ncbi:MAG: response regulator [Blautia sp.]|nr:response regulator [Blautia sp.]